jgi:RimJ/RimL family protein N-acetyltransferase
MSKVNLKGGPDGARLAVATMRHAAAFRDGFNSGIAAPTTRWHLPRPLPAIARDSHALRRYAILVHDRVVGTCRLWHPQFAGVELAIAIFDPHMRGRGIGTFAVRTMCAAAFDELHEHRVELGVYPDNAAAIRVYEKCGFKREALLRSYIHHEGHWRDLLWMALLRKEYIRRR